MDDSFARQLSRLAARVATRHGFRRISSIGDVDWSEVSMTHGGLEIQSMSNVDTLPEFADLARKGRNHPELLVAVVPADLERSRAQRLGELIQRVTVGIVALAEGDGDEAVERILAETGCTPTFAGHARDSSNDAARILIYDRSVGLPSKAPDEFTVLAIMTAYNESDIIASTIEALFADRLRVHIVDNWSTDGTWEIAQTYSHLENLVIERYPREAALTFDLRALLAHEEDVAAASDAHWIIHHDADERRRAPWSGVGMRDGLWTVQTAGFNAIDHIVLNFRPTDNNFRQGMDPEAYFTGYELGTGPDRVRINAWRNGHARVTLAPSGGHQADFQGRRVFPYRFLLKHYPIRSQDHAERKLFRDRIPRWNLAERAAGWHVQYDSVQADQVFTWKADQLTTFGQDTYGNEIMAIVGGVDIDQPQIPRWTRRNAITRTVYVMTMAVRSSSPCISIRDSWFGQHPLMRSAAAMLKAFMQKVLR